MSLHILHSHRLDYLFETFVQIGFQKQIDFTQILQAKHIIVPNDAMQEWLKIQLAQAMGISAHLQFHQGITSFQWFIYQQLAQKRDDVRDANLPRLIIKWQIYHYLSPSIQTDTLNISAQHPLFPLLQRIYERGHFFNKIAQQKQARQQMLYWIAEQVSQVFGHYLLYRPEWLNLWSAGQRLNIEQLLNQQLNDDINDVELQRATELEQWQSFLWHQLFAQRYQQIRQVDNTFWTNIQQHQTQGTLNFHTPLMIFTLLNLAPTQLAFIEKLSQYIDIVLFYFSPTQEYWADSVDPRWKQQQDLKIKQRIRQKFPDFSEQQFQDYFNDLNQHFNAELREARHPLLTRFGKQARDHFSLLAQLSGGEQGEMWIDVFNDPQHGEPMFAQGILGKIQQDIFYLIDPVKQDYQLDPNDQSLQIHVCHSVLRQLEVLKEQVLYWLSQGTAEKPRSPQDILVIVPDLAELEPSIRSLFYSHTQQLPIQMIGTHSFHTQQAWHSFVFRIRWQNQRFSIQQFSDWLSLSATQQYYDLNVNDAQRMIALLEQAGFKRGFDQAHLQQQLEHTDNDFRFSFAYALNRLAMGVAVPKLLECQTAQESIISHHQVNLEDFALIDKLLFIFQDFHQHRDWLNHDQYARVNVVTWLQRLLQDIDEWQLRGVEHLSTVRDVIKKYDTMLSLSYHTQHRQQQGDESLYNLKYLNIPLAELLDEIEQQLQQHVSHHDSTGTMTFSQIGQMRPLAYPLIILLNLERGVFPARNPTPAFDLIQLCRSQLGDRSRLDDHQGAFLDSIVLAQQELWLFYTGIDAESGETLEPSSVVQELINHLKHLVYLPEHANSYSQVHGINLPTQLQSLFYIHPSEPFLPHGFSETNITRLHNQWYDIAQSLNQQHLQDRPPHWLDAQNASNITQQTIDAEQWFKELEFPARALLRHFNIANMRGADLQDEFEPLLLNPLQQYQLYDVMVKDLEYRNTAHITSIPPALSLRLPIGNLAQPVRDKSLNYQQQIQNYLTQHQLSITQTTQYIWQNNDLHLSVRLPKILHQPIWCRVLPNKAKGKYRLRVWLNHLLWLMMLDDSQSLNAVNYQTITIMQDGLLITTGISKKQAELFLNQWITAWKFAQHSPLLLSANLVFDNLLKDNEKNWCQTENHDQFSDELSAKIVKQWQNPYSHINAEQNESSRSHLDWQFILQQLDDQQILQQNCIDFAHLYYPMTQYQQLHAFDVGAP